MKIYNSTQNNILSEDFLLADNLISRSFGLILKNKLKEGEALVIKPCCSIHTFFMRFQIDVIFVNNKNEVIAAYEDVYPRRILPIHFSSSYVIEMKSGSISQKNLKKGDLLTFLD